MFRFLSHPFVRAGFSITDHNVRHFSVVRFSITTPWRSVPRFNTLCLGTACPVQFKQTDEQRRQFAESVQPTFRRRSRDKTDVSASSTNHERDTEIPEPPRAFGEYANRMRFNKSSPQYVDLQYNEGEEVKQRLKFKSRTGRRNTPYWYFLQFKKLIKQDQVK